MENDSLYLMTYWKFKNLIIPDLPSIIFISLIDDKDSLCKLMNIDFKVEDFIAYLVKKKDISKRIQVLKALQEFLKERGENIEFGIFKQ